MEIQVLTTILEVMLYGAAWTDLAASELLFVPTFDALLEAISVENTRFNFIVARENGTVKALACFIFWDHAKTIEIGRFRLFTMNVPTAALFGNAWLGEPDQATSMAMLAPVMADPRARLIELVETPLASSLHSAARAMPAKTLISENRTNNIRRLIAFGDGMKAYMAGLRKTTRRGFTRAEKTFAELSPTFRTFRTVEEAKLFLTEAAELGSRTYQSELGFVHVDDEPTRRHFVTLAEKGQFRGYLAYIDGKACAYGSGDIAHDVFYWRLTGYAPEVRDHSAGTALLYYMLQDMTAEKCCARFDFGTFDRDYKRRFANMDVPCTNMSVARWNSPRAIFFIAFQIMIGRLRDIRSARQPVDGEDE